MNWWPRSSKGLSLNKKKILLEIDERLGEVGFSMSTKQKGATISGDDLVLLHGVIPNYSLEDNTAEIIGVLKKMVHLYNAGVKSVEKQKKSSK